MSYQHPALTASSTPAAWNPVLRHDHRPHARRDVLGALTLLYMRARRPTGRNLQQLSPAASRPRTVAAASPDGAPLSAYTPMGVHERVSLAVFG